MIWYLGAIQNYYKIHVFVVYQKSYDAIQIVVKNSIITILYYDNLNISLQWVYFLS